MTQTISVEAKKRKVVKRKRKPYSVTRAGIGGARSKLSESLIVLCWDMIAEWLERKGAYQDNKKCS